MVAGSPSVALAAVFCSVAVSAAPVRLRVTGDRVNLRARPSLEAEVVGQVSAGEELLPADGPAEGSEWVKVSPPDGTDLWIYSRLLTDGAVNAGDTLVRGGPGLRFKPVGRLPKGARVVVRGAQGDWTKVAPVPGRCALWIHSDYVAPVVPPRAAPDPAPAAKGPAGRPMAGPAPAKTPPRTVPASSPPRAAAPPDAVAAPAPVPEAAPAARTPGDIPRRPEKAAPAAAPSRAGTAPAVMKTAGVDVAPKVLPVTDDVAPAVPGPEPPGWEGVPASLAGMALDPHYRQGEESVLRGRLRRAGPAFGASPARYRLVENQTTVCLLTGCVGQWDELVRSEVEARGTLWMLAGDPVPVLHVVRADRLASWGG